MTPSMRPETVLETCAEGPDGTRLYVRRRQGPTPLTALLCDGIVCDGFIYKYLWDDLAPWCSVAHWNYRGHGRSASPVDPQAIEVVDHARDLDAVRRHLDDPPVVLIGHSFGCQVALEAYRYRPERIQGLVLLCGGCGEVTRTFRGSDLLDNVLPDLIRFVEQYPVVARALWSRVPPRIAFRLATAVGDLDARAVQLSDLEPYFQHATHVDFEMFLRMLQSAGRHSAQDLLEHVRVPTLVVAGERDTFTPSAVSCALAQAIPGGELLLLPDATHVAPLEHRESLALRIHKFLTAHGLIAG